MDSSNTFALLCVKTTQIGVRKVAFNDRSLAIKKPIIVTNIREVDPPCCTATSCLRTLCLCGFCGLVDACCGKAVVSYYEAEEVTLAAFAKRVSEMKGITDVLLWQHGFTNVPSEVLSLMGGSNDLQGVYKPNILVVPVIWNSVVIRSVSIAEQLGYVVDRVRAEITATCLRNFFLQANTECKKNPLAKKVIGSGNLHILAHSMGCYVFFKMVEGLKPEEVKMSLDCFKFGLIILKQANAPPDWFKNGTKNFENVGSKTVQIGKRVIVTWTRSDAVLEKLSNLSIATNIYGPNDLGYKGPGDTKHISNLLQINATAEIVPPGLKSYHSYQRHPTWVEFTKKQIKAVKEMKSSQGNGMYPNVGSSA